MKWMLAFLLCLVLSGIAPAQDSGSVSNIDDSSTSYPPTGWKPGFNSPCILPGCDPGGNGIPTSTTQSTGHASPSTDGSSMLLRQVAPAASNGTNVLWSDIVSSGSTTNITNGTFHFKIYLDSGMSGLVCCIETDWFIFKTSNGKNYMFGMQCNYSTSVWDIWNQLAVAWVATTIPCNVTFNTWHEITEVGHVVGDNMSFDSITIDGTPHAIGVQQPSGPLDQSWVSAIGVHFQSDVKPAGSSSANMDMYVDEVSLSWDSSGSNPPPLSLHGITITCLNAPIGLNRRQPQLFNAQFTPSTPIKGTSSLLVYWNDDPNADTWTIKRSETPGGPYTTLSTGLAQAGCLDNKVKPRTTYYYVVTATNSIGTSGNSQEMSRTTP